MGYGLNADGTPDGALRPFLQLIADHRVDDLRRDFSPHVNVPSFRDKLNALDYEMVLALERVLSMDEMAGLVAMSQEKPAVEQVAV